MAKGINFFAAEAAAQEKRQADIERSIERKAEMPVPEPDTAKREPVDPAGKRAEMLRVPSTDERYRRVSINVTDEMNRAMKMFLLTHGEYGSQSSMVRLAIVEFIENHG